MGGDCGVESRLGEGSTFWFTIRVPADAGQAVPLPGRRRRIGRTCAALVVDDNATQRSVLSAYLTEWGMKVSTAADAETALTLLRIAAAERKPVAVVLVDRIMPGMDGLALKNAIVATPGLAVGVVFMTNRRQESDVGETPSCVKCAFLTKPIRRQDLRSSLRVALGLESAASVPTPTVTLPPPPVGEPTLGHLLLAEDNLINQKVAVAILTSAGYSVDTVLNGAEAVARCCRPRLRRHLDGLPDARARRLRGDPADPARRGAAAACRSSR